MIEVIPTLAASDSNNTVGDRESAGTPVDAVQPTVLQPARLDVRIAIARILVELKGADAPHGG